MRGRAIAVLLLIGALGAAPAAAQARLGGVVRDAATGTPLAGARVLLTNTLLATTTDSLGRFRFTELDPGPYRLRAAAVGYASDTLPTLELAAGDTREVVIRLAQQALELSTVVVTANRRPETTEQAEVSVAILTREELLRRNVVRIDEALAFVPGITFNGESQMDLRGATGVARGVGSRVLILLDGHPALSGDGGEIIFDALPLLDLQQVEVVKGAYSAVYGSNALGGVVNLITSRIPEQPRTLGRAHYGVYTPQGDRDFDRDRLSQQGLSVQHSRWLGNVGIRVGLDRETSDGFTQNGSYARWNARVRAQSRPEANRPWDAYAVWSRNAAGEFFTWAHPERPYEVTSDELGDRAVYRMLLSGATVTPIASSGTLLQVSPHLNWNENRNHFHDNDNWHRATRAGTTVQLTLMPQGGAHTASFGVDGAWTGISSNFIGDPAVRDGAVFAQDQLQLGNRLRATLGFRFDLHSATGGQSESSLNPKVSLAWTATDRLTLRGSLARGYRAPSAIEQFVETVQYGIRVIPNPGLLGEHAWSAEIGAAATAAGSVRLDAALFQSTYQDLIGPGVAPGQFFVFQFQNVSRARVRGLDFSAQAAAGPVELRGNYLYLDATDLDTGNPLPYRSRHNLTGTADLLGGLLGVDLRFRSRVRAVLAYPLDPRGEITTVDLRAGFQVGDLTALAKVSNLFNTFYTDVQERNPGAPRNLSLTLLSGF